MTIKENLKQSYEEFRLRNMEDEYSQAVIFYAERLAEALEKIVSETGKLFSLSEALALSHSLDYDGITGFMYHAARSTLYHYWIYGEYLEEILSDENN